MILNVPKILNFIIPVALTCFANLILLYKILSVGLIFIVPL